MNTLKSILLCTLLAPLAVAHAQESLGEILDQGGTLLTKDELQGQLIGAHITWTTPNGLIKFDTKPTEDGYLPGTVTGTLGSNALSDGSWKITDDGRFCMSAKYQLKSVAGTIDRCAFWFKLGDAYWVTGANSDRAAKMFRYAVKK